MSLISGAPQPTRILGRSLTVDPAAWVEVKPCVVGSSTRTRGTHGRNDHAGKILRFNMAWLRRRCQSLHEAVTMISGPSALWSRSQKALRLLSSRNVASASGLHGNGLQPRRRPAQRPKAVRVGLTGLRVILSLRPCPSHRAPPPICIIGRVFLGNREMHTGCLTSMSR